MTPTSRGWFAFKAGGMPHASFDGETTLCGRQLVEKKGRKKVAVAQRVDFVRKPCSKCLKALVEKGGAWLVPSSTLPGKLYLVEKTSAGSYTCTCEAGQHSVECRHVRAVRKETE